MTNNIRRVKPEDVYYSWLCDLIEVNQELESRWILVKDLHRKTFYYSVPLDANRSGDGVELRNRFIDEMGYQHLPDNYFVGPCTMLEMLIGLAYRCEFIMSGQDDATSKPMKYWFWKMLENCGLSRFTDERYFELNGSMHVEHTMNKIIERSYHRNGHGGLFPLKKHKKDQRKVELWYQMSEYLNENYFQEEEFRLR